ncbi:hypothetical protein PanWU01x14_147900 [Parasponia andersonii]|uniref:Uncharacterized protein n=1 Tax=Parasponia andersonii TaxID=3476 RepID=A0A2P5CJH7_PARAD|nr:hypothetical protein PanWU01x14_147900 [Parasponia andersonii]
MTARPTKVIEFSVRRGRSGVSRRIGGGGDVKANKQWRLKFKKKFTGMADYMQFLRKSSRWIHVSFKPETVQVTVKPLLRRSTIGLLKRQVSSPSDVDHYVKDKDVIVCSTGLSTATKNNILLAAISRNLLYLEKGPSSSSSSEE